MSETLSLFVSRKITYEIEKDIISPLAQTLLANNYQLKAALEQLFMSQHFYDLDDHNADNEIIGALIKSPLDLALQALNFFELAIPDPKTDAMNHYNQFYKNAVQDVMLSKAGFDIFQPPSVAGYPPYHQEPNYQRGWFNSNSIIPRFKLPEMLLQSKRILSGGNLGGVKLNIVDFVRKGTYFPTPQDAESVVKGLVNYMLPEEPDDKRIHYFLNEVFLNGLSPKNWEVEWNNYRKSGDDSDVKIPLSNLVQAIMYSPEYQLF
ncbi:MAG: DUF1800 domain-containing protein [Bacteroidia bacterium]|nr:DUF1800 domain-containing protein [Bacteroidia bacterium]